MLLLRKKQKKILLILIHLFIHKPVKEAPTAKLDQMSNFHLTISDIILPFFLLLVTAAKLRQSSKRHIKNATIITITITITF